MGETEDASQQTQTSLDRRSVCGHEVVKIIVDKRRLVNAIQDYGGENCCYDQARDW